MNTEYAVTAFLIAIAGLLSLSAGIPVLFNLEFIAAGILVGLIAAFIDAYRIKVLIEEGAKSTVDYMSVQKPITVTQNMGSQMVEQAMMGFQKQMTKAMGKSLLAFEKVIELALRSTAAFCGIVAIAVYFLGWDFAFPFGMWIILGTLAVTALMKMSGVFSFAFGLVSSSFVPLSAYTNKAKQLVTAVAAAGIVSWLLFAMQWWVTLVAFGESVNVFAIFLLYALVTLFAFAPYSIDGIGWMELVSVLLIPLLGVSGAAVFVTVIIWEFTRLAGNSVSFWLLQRLQTRKDVAQFR